MGAEWCREQLEEMPGCRLAIVARTIADARDTCVEGESGLLACFPPSVRAALRWNRSEGAGELPNGSQWKCFTSEKPDSLRGPQFHVLWADELAAWEKQRAAWAQVPYIVRLPWAKAPHRAGRVVITTTPRPFVEIRELLKDPLTVVARGTSFENWHNLNALTRAKLEKLRGTRMGRQELLAELLDDTPGALWTRALLDSLRRDEAPALSRVVVAIDPAVTVSEESDETGIVAAGVDDKRHRYVLRDVSGRFKPAEWAERAIALFDELEADQVIVEVNNGGDMVAATLRTLRPSLPIREVRASRGKRTRAEPVATAYEKGDVHHVGLFERLEDQLCTWTPEEPKSPDRLDAMVWALTALDSVDVGPVREKVRKAKRQGLAAMDL